MDFTLSTYRRLLTSFLQNGYKIVTFRQYLEEKPDGKYLILRHDVDELPGNALKMAVIENELAINATYYFRIVNKSNNPEIIRKIAGLGHEVGYHYEDLSASAGSLEKAVDSFKRNLEYFRTFYPVVTVCMHGSSTSEYDNRLIWKHYNLEDFGLLGEPYLSVDFDKVFYLTDTGYAWDGGKFAVRDVVSTPFKIKFHFSEQIINAVRNGTFPPQSMILAHTLWCGGKLQWLALHIREFVRNRVKLLARNNKTIARLYKKMVFLYWKG